MAKESRSTTVILLAGGTGTRLGGAIPKQFLPLGDRSVLQHSLDVLGACEDVSEIVIVCDQRWRAEIDLTSIDLPISFAEPGVRRQDSVYHGLQQMNGQPQLTCIHDGARPFIDCSLVDRVIRAAEECQAAAAAIPARATIKVANQKGRVLQTLARSSLWEVQTPQVIRTDLLRLAFHHAFEENSTVTDDVALVEAMGQSVQLVCGKDENFKITTYHDLQVARLLLEDACVRKTS